MPSARLSAAMHNKNDCVKNLAGLVPGIGYGLWRARVSRGVNYAPLSMWGKPNANTKYPQKQKVIRWRGARGTSNVPDIVSDSFARMDRNGDGQISSSELAEGVLGGASEAAAGVPEELVEYIAQELLVPYDNNGDGALNKVEFAESLR